MKGESLQRVRMTDKAVGKWRDGSLGQCQRTEEVGVVRRVKREGLQRSQRIKRGKSLPPGRGRVREEAVGSGKGRGFRRTPMMGQRGEAESERPRSLPRLKEAQFRPVVRRLGRAPATQEKSKGSGKPRREVVTTALLADHPDVPRQESQSTESRRIPNKSRP